MNETMTVRKIFWIWEFEKEEQWLNAMAMDGWTLDSVKFTTYRFVRTQPGEYIVRLQMCEDDSYYRSFLEEIGAEYVGRCNRWYYFRRKADLGEFELFSDLDSKLQHLNRVAKLLKILTFANLCIGLGNSIGANHFGFLNLLVAALTAYGLGRIHGKTEYLQFERTLHE